MNASRFGALPGNELLLRVCSSIVLAALALAAAYLGGWWFTALWATAAAIVFYEWIELTLTNAREWPLLTGTAALLIALGLCALDKYGAAAAVIAVGCAAVAAVTPGGRRIWVAAGVVYALVLAASPILLRSDEHSGLLAIVFVFATVWATDTSAYFAGRSIGGAKLIPQISPHKTWAGALAGTAAAAAVGLVVAKAAALSTPFTMMALAASLSVFAQCGDLFESYMKRRFGVKDSGHLIPGHGGLMDRLDGFATASLLAAIVAVGRGGLESPGRGLLVW